MARSRVLAATAAGSALVLASLLIASPAQAFTPAAGQKITVPGYFDGVIYDANPVDAALTAVGGANAIPDGKHLSAIDVNDDGVGYAIATSFEGGEWLPSYVMPADAKLGTLGAAVPIVITSSGGENALGCNSLDMPSPGVLWAACFGFDGDDGYFTYVGNLDPVSGVLTSSRRSTPRRCSPRSPPTHWMACSTASCSPAANNDVGPVDLDGANILDPAVPLPGLNPTWGADFDRDGQLFVSAWEFQGMAATSHRSRSSTPLQARTRHS